MSPVQPSPAVPGWPFLVAPGRRLDYTVVMAPEFMVAAGEGGRLADVVAPGESSDPARVVSISTPSSPHLAVAYRTHVAIAADLSDPVGGPPPAPPRDEHNRPLRLAYGFVTHVLPDDPRYVDADVDACRPLALAAYRRFLDDEPAFAVLPSRAVPVRCVSNRIDPHPITTAVARTPGSPRTEPVLGHPVHRGVLLGLVAAVMAVVFALAMAVRGASAPTCPAPTESTGRTVAGSTVEATCSP